MLTERRQFGRRDVVQEGLIEAPLRQPFPCEVRNVSTAGALLAYDPREYVPARFNLRVGRFQTTCVVAHRARGLVGVNFEVHHEPAAPEPLETAPPVKPTAIQAIASLLGLTGR